MGSFISVSALTAQHLIIGESFMQVMTLQSLLVSVPQFMPLHVSYLNACSGIIMDSFFSSSCTRSMNSYCLVHMNCA